MKIIVLLIGSPSPRHQCAPHDTSSIQFRRNLYFKDVQVIYFKPREHF